MPKRSSKSRDVNEIAAGIVGAVTGATEKAGKVVQAGRARLSALAAELGRRGGLKGGKARAEKLSAKKRKAIAKKAAAARWQKSNFGQRLRDITDELEEVAETLALGLDDAFCAEVERRLAEAKAQRAEKGSL